MALYNENEELYLEIDVYTVSLGASLPKMRDGMLLPRNKALDNAVLWQTALVSKSLTSAEPHYSTTEREALSILHGPGKFHHYCFTCEVSMITYHKALLAIFKKETQQAYHTDCIKYSTHSPIQHMNSLQTWTTAIHSRLSIQTQPWEINTQYMHNYNAIESCMDTPDCMTTEEISWQL